MTSTDRSTAADRFFELHAERGRAFVLPNCWDAASARIFEEQGFPAVGTSSAGMAFALGHADGERVDVEEAFGAIARIVRSVRIPVSADLEAGYGFAPDETVATLERAAALGAVGCNLEDYDSEKGTLIATDAQCERIRAAKARLDTLSARFFLNARTDILLKEIGEQATRVERTIARLRAYVAAGADGVFAPGTADPQTIATIAGAVGAPLNVLAGPQTPSLSELQRLGVIRVSVGSRPMLRTLGLVREIARELRERGTFTFMDGASVTYVEANALFTR
ncbi:MAG: isocitrate lyase/PEP mutase family protein [Vulcanimicrobiaceae bacterium]